MTRSLRAALLGGLLCALVLSAPGALAQDDDDASGEQPRQEQPTGRTTWSVRPATAEGRDNRSWIEITLEPGESAQEYLAVRNLSATTRTFSVTAADGYMTHTGRFNMLSSDQESVAAGTWIDVQPEVTVDAGDTAIVPFTITIPERVEPGDHPAGMAASVFSGTSREGGGAVGVESRVGFRVMIRVPGDLEPAIAIEEARTTYERSWNPFSAGTMTVEYVVVNDGNVRLTGEHTVTVSGQVSEVEPLGELFVDDRRDYLTTVSQVWPLLRVRTAIDVVPEPIADDAPAMEPVRLELTSWVMPWPQLGVLAGLVLLVMAVLWGRRRRKRVWEERLAAARAEGRATATETETEEVDAEPRPETKADAEPRPETKADAEPDARTEAEADTKAGTTRSKPNPRTRSKTKADAEPDARTEAEADAKAGTTRSKPNPRTRSKTKADAEPEARTEADAKAGTTRARTRTRTKTEAKTEAGAGAGAGTKADTTRPKTETEAKTEAEADTGADTKAGTTRSRTRSRTRTDAEAEAKTEAGAGAGTTRSKPRTRTRTDAEAATRIEAEAGTKADTARPKTEEVEASG